MALSTATIIVLFVIVCFQWVRVGSLKKQIKNERAEKNILNIQYKSKEVHASYLNQRLQLFETLQMMTPDAIRWLHAEEVDRPHIEEFLGRAFLGFMNRIEDPSLVLKLFESLEVMCGDMFARRLKDACEKLIKQVSFTEEIERYKKFIASLKL